jgi:predicted CoA-binding protein
MASRSPAIAEFLAGRSIAVAGVSRTGQSAGNNIFQVLTKAGYDVVPVNPKATEVEGVRCFPSLGAIGRPLDGVVIATHARDTMGVVQECAALGVRRVWIHKAIGPGSVSREAVDRCRELGIACIPGGCPVMYCEPVDTGHKCLRWILDKLGTLPR